MAKGRPPPFVSRGAKATPPPRKAPPRAAPTPPSPPPAAAPMMADTDMDGYNKGGRVKKSFGKFPKGKAV